MSQKQIAIVGGGASGMTAAIAAAGNGARVTLFEQKDRIGKKILSTGNGRCNFTNRIMDRSCYRGDDTSIADVVLQTFGTEETLSFFGKLGMEPKDRNGYLYPASDQASAVLDVLRMELDRLQVEVITKAKVSNITPARNGYRIVYTDDRGDNISVQSDAVILAAGGKATPVLGSDGSGYTLAEALGHTLSPVVPALTALKGKGGFFKRLSGIRTEAKVRLLIDGIYAAEDRGELQLTDYGISGIPVFQVSRFASKALGGKKEVAAEIDFVPYYTAKEWTCYLKKRLAAQSHKTSEEAFIGLFHKKLIPVLLSQARIDPAVRVKKWSDAQRTSFSQICRAFPIRITGTNAFEQSQVCAGGVRTGEVDHNTMESLYNKGLYLTGELLDIDGICGGYNLQWAWATGFLAGTHAAKGLSQ